MMFFLNFADPLGKIHHAEFVATARKHHVPTLIDAAADVPPVENLWKYTKLGFDLVGFSGGKGLRGPQSTGLLLGRKDLIDAARLNNSPNGDTLCRTNKVNKEEVIGMLVALECYLKEDHAAVWKEWEDRDAAGSPRHCRVSRRSHRGSRARDRQRCSAPEDHLGRNQTGRERSDHDPEAP